MGFAHGASRLYEALASYTPLWGGASFQTRGAFNGVFSALFFLIHSFNLFVHNYIFDYPYIPPFWFYLFQYLFFFTVIFSHYFYAFNFLHIFMLFKDLTQNPRIQARIQEESKNLEKKNICGFCFLSMIIFYTLFVLFYCIFLQ